MGDTNETHCPNLEPNLYPIILEKALDVLDMPKNYSQIGGGACGMAYLSNNKVYKITTDKSEAVESNKLVGKNNQHLANIFDVKKINTTLTDVQSYLIVLEYLNISKSSIFSDIEEELLDMVNIVFNENLFDIIYTYQIDPATYKNEYEEGMQGIFDTNPREKYYYNSLLKIVDELKANNIDSLDIQYHNLGLKPNGNLAFFDLGFGDTKDTHLGSIDITENNLSEFISQIKTSIEKQNITIEQFAEKISKKLGYDNPIFIGKGTQGYAFDLNNEMILKITSDHSEANEAVKLLGKNNNHIGNIYKVQKVSQPYENIWVILREKLDVHLNRFDIIYNEFYNYIGEHSMSSGDIREILLQQNTIKLNKLKSIIDGANDNVKQFYNVIVDLFNNKVKSIDFSGENFGFKKNGDLAYYDIGYSEDKTKNNFEILNVDERVKTYMKGSSTFKVKDKCKFGGNADGTSKACDTGDISNFSFSNMDESIEDYRNVNDSVLENVVQYLEGLIDIVRPKSGTELSKLVKSYLIISQNIDKALEKSNDDIKFYNNLMKVKDVLKNFGLMVESPVLNEHTSRWNKMLQRKWNELGKEKIVSYEEMEKELRKEKALTANENDIRAIVEYELGKMSEGINVYHGTMTPKFDAFSSKKIGSTNQREMGGWGIYLSDNPNVARQYGKNILNAEIPNGTYLELDDTVDNHLAEFILKSNLPFSDIEQFKSDFIADDYIYDTTNNQVLEWLKDVLADSKKAMDFIAKAGFIGTKFSDKTNRDATNYVIFDPTLIKIKDSDEEYDEMNEQDTGFDRKTFDSIQSFAKRKQYADQHYQKLGAGSSRIVYKLPSGNVLKLAKNAKGLAQNENECGLGQDQYFGELLAKVVDCDQNDLWVVSEEAKKITPQRFEEITGTNFEEVGKLIRNVYAGNRSRSMDQVVKQDQAIIDELYENQFVSQLLEMMNSYNLGAGDLARIDSYGEVLRNGQPDIVLRDYGLNDEIWKQHYGGSKNRRLYEDYFEMNEQKDVEISDLPFKNDVEQAGGKIYSVGGAVRDKILGRESKDLDLLITGVPLDQLEGILKKYGKVDNVGKSFGIIKFNTPELGELDIAIPRTETKNDAGGYQGFDVTSDHTLPIEKDLERRDFTINAIAKDSSGLMIDPYGGQGDIEKKQIKMVNPQAFSDDPLRMLRAVQFAARFGFEIEPETMNAIQQNAAKIKEISPERILIEFDKIVKKGSPMIGAKLLRQSGLYNYIFGVNRGVNLAEFKNVSTMGEFIYSLIHGAVQSPAEFYKKNLKGDLDTYQELKALEIGGNFNGDRKTIFDMYKNDPESINTKIFGENFTNTVNYMKTNNIPLSLKEVPVNGNDLMELGFQGKQIGELFVNVLSKIYKEELPNERGAILNYLKNKNNLNENIYSLSDNDYKRIDYSNLMKIIERVINFKDRSSDGKAIYISNEELHDHFYDYYALIVNRERVNDMLSLFDNNQHKLFNNNRSLIYNKLKEIGLLK